MRPGALIVIGFGWKAAGGVGKRAGSGYEVKSFEGFREPERHGPECSIEENCKPWTYTWLYRHTGAGSGAKRVEAALVVQPRKTVRPGHRNDRGSSSALFVSRRIVRLVEVYMASVFNS